MTVVSATISHTTRTSVTSMSKYSAKPRQTPAILRPKRGRTRRVRALDAPEPLALAARASFLDQRGTGTEVIASGDRDYTVHRAPSTPEGVRQVLDMHC